ncbi:MAG: hypothetical protein ACLUD0_21250 [Eubacterium ramulus]
MRYIGLFVMPFFIYLGAAAMEGWQGIPNAESGQASGVNTEQTMSTDTDQSLGAGVVWHTAMESSAVSDTDTDTESEQFTEEELQAFCGNRLYRCDKLTDTKKDCNALLFYGAAECEYVFFCHKSAVSEFLLQCSENADSD